MLNISNLSKSYGPQKLFSELSFTVGRNERVGLVGRNGHGKTTIFRMILGEEHADSGTITMPKGYSVGHLSQILKFSKDNVLDEACLALMENADGWIETYRAETVLSGLGFAEVDFTRKPAELSGGFQIRLNLAKVLLSNPNLLLLDEPTNYLDIVSVRWLRSFLLSWEGELIIITHDREFMDSVSTHTAAIHRGKLKKIAGSSTKLYEMIAQEEEIHEKTRLNQQKKRDEVERFISRFRAKASKASSVQSRVKALEKLEVKEELRDIENLDFQFNAAPFPGKWLMEAKNLSFSFPGGPELVSDLSFAVGAKDRIGIIGKNGRGKTTLLNLLAGELTPLKGSVSKNINTQLSYFGQTNINRLSLDKTIESEFVDLHVDHNRGVARKIAGLMMFEGDAALKKISVLSGGERSRVLLGKILLTPSNLLLLDEPTNHLDMYSIDSLLEAIDAFPGAVLIVTHSEMILRALCTRLIVFDRDKATLIEATYEDFLKRVGWQNEDQNRTSKPSGTNAREQKLNKKELRKLRAEKNNIIGPLKREVARIEDEIMRLEAEVKASNEELAAASASGDAEAITSLSTKTHQLAKFVNALYLKLERAEEELKIKITELGESIA